jgi:transposase
MSWVAGVWKVQLPQHRRHKGGKEPAAMSSLTSPAGAIHLGMDTSKNTIVVAVLMPGEEVPVIDRLWNEEGSVRHLVGRFADRGALRACYEAGPCGFELHRLLASMGVACDVVAPSLIPRRAGDRVKTDKRDAGRLARLHRAGELTAIRVPTEAEEAVRDLVRARAALLADRKRAQQRLTAMLLRHGRVWRSGSCWTQAHEQWIAAQRFTEPALASALAHYRAALDTRQAELDAVEAELAPWAGREPLAPAVARLGCYRGIAELTGLTLAAEIGDWRRFPSARAFMSFTGLVPAEYSSGERTRRGSITKAGSEPARTALIEAAWSYRFRPAIGATLRRRQHGADPATLARSWQAQRRLHARYKAMTARGKPAGVAVTAMARELAGFVWAEMTS